MPSDEYLQAVTIGTVEKLAKGKSMDQILRK